MFDTHYFAEAYRNYPGQNPPRKLDFYDALVRRHLPRRSCPASILELGCGPGLFLERLGPAYRRFGVDLSTFAAGLAHRRVPEAGMVVGNAEHPPFRAVFDAIVALDVLEHVDGIESVASFVDSALAPDGIFLFVVPVYDGPLGPVVHLLDRDTSHIHKRSRWWWLSWAARRFNVVSWGGVFRYLLPRGPYLHWPTQLLRRIAPAISVVCASRVTANGLARNFAVGPGQPVSGGA